MKITTIDQEAIDLGIQDNCEQCPIAIAMRKNGYIEPIIGEDYISYYESETGIHMITTPVSKRIRIRIRRFDNGQNIRPFKMIEEDIFDIYEGE